MALAAAMVLTGRPGCAQEIAFREYAPLDAVYGEVWESDELLPMQEIGVESGYVLYETEIESESEVSGLVLDHVRDYAAVYLDDRFAGSLTDARNSLPLQVPAGRHRLRLYVENIGRITYGPEILDNSKGLFGQALLGGEPIGGWRIIPLLIRESDLAQLDFGPLGERLSGPGFRRGVFDCAEPADCYLDVSGWGMGEVWLNGHYLGSFWDEEKQCSIRIPARTLLSEGNVLVVFDLKNCDPAARMRLSAKPVFN